MQVLAKMLINKKKMSTTDTKERILVWTKTERAGDIVTVDKIDGDFTLFTDGTRCYTNIIGEELLHFKSVENKETIDLSSLSNGIYFLEINKSQTIKLLLNK